MKLFYFRLLAIFGVLATIVSCTKDKTTTGGTDEQIEYTAEFVLGTPGIYDVEMTLTGSNIVGYAYIVETDLDATAPDAAILFAEGVTGSVTQAETSISVRSLEGNTEYKIFACAEFDTIGYGDVVELESFTTANYTDFVTVLPSDDMYSKKMYINVPEGSTIAYVGMDLDDYSTFTSSYMYIDADFFYNTAKTKLNVITESQVVTVDGFAPGQAIQIMVVEVEEGEVDYYGNETYSAKYDYDAYSEAFSAATGVDQNDFWLTECHYSESTNITPPVLVDAPVECEILSKTTKSVTMSFKMNDQIDQFAYIYFDTATWNLLCDTFGYDGAIYFSTAYSSVGTSDMTYTASGLQVGLTYQMILIGHVNEDGTEHSINIVEFAPVEATLPAPVMSVTPIDAPQGETESPLRVWFNIKCDSKDASYIKYLCNDYRAWQFELNAGSSYSALMASNGQVINDADIMDEINSDAGYNIVFSSMEESTTGLLVTGVNSEETESSAELAGSYAENSTGSIPDAPRVESDLFETLKGEWTATAYLMETNDSGYTYYPSTTATTAQVNICSAPSYPDELTEDVYAAYESIMSRDEVDALFEEFKASSQHFEEKVRGQNRLLCEGLDFGYNGTDYYSPFDLFYDDYYYGAVTTDDLFYDFGPKWYLEIAEDGSISVPIDYTTMAPFNGYSYSSPLYLYALDPVNLVYNTDMTSYDVTLSEDGNTITFAPLIVDDVEYLFSSGYTIDYSGYSFFVQTFMCHSLVLTRNTTATAAPAVPSKITYPGFKTNHTIQATAARTRLTPSKSQIRPSIKVEGVQFDINAALLNKSESAFAKYGLQQK
ncbi:MAG: hypothetical protein R3Y08_06035 [Rikenellaceae bacterium]